MKQTDKIALALSGGGFRATLFHLGSLCRLNECGLLPKLKCVSGISGGSIITAWFGLRFRDLKFNDKGTAVNFEEVVSNPIRKFCSKNIDVAPGLLNMLFMLWGGTSGALATSYKRGLFGRSTTADLPDGENGPEVIIGASNLQTGGRVEFSGARLYAERLGFIDSPNIQISDVVAASTAFPPFLSPFILRTDPGRWRRLDDSDLFDDEGLRSRMVLTDGGIHDPSGVEQIIHGQERRKYGLILVSDGSITKEVWRTPSAFWIRQLGRSTIMQTVSNSQARKNLLKLLPASNEKRVVWWSNSDTIDSFERNRSITVAAPKYDQSVSAGTFMQRVDDNDGSFSAATVMERVVQDNDLTRSLSTVRTRLNRFSNLEQGRLINWGYALCDAAVRSSGILDFDAIPVLPVREYPL